MPEIQLAPGARESDIIAAINALPEGGTIILPEDATISITTGLNISLAGRDITIDLNGSTLRQDANVSVITARGKHPTPEGVTIGQDASGNTTITYSGTAPDVSFGSWIKVVSDDTLPGDHLDGSQPTRMGQAMEVLSVNGNTVTLRGALIDQAKYVTNVRATEYESGQLVIKNGEIVGDSGQGGRTAALVNLRNTVDAQVDDLFIHDASGTGISVVDGVNTQITDVNIKNFFDVPGALGIGVHSLSSLGTTVKGLYAENVTHATDDNSIGNAANSTSVNYYGGDIGMHVSDSVAYGTRNFAYSWHSEAVNGQYDHVMAFNSHGFLMARGIGGDISDSGGAGNARGIAFYQWGNGDGRNITVDNVTLKETQYYSTTAINNPQDNTITDSYFESYSYTAPLDPKYAITTNTAYVRTNSETLNDTIIGTAADDLLLGAKGDDVISGGDGNDYIWGGEGIDTLTGGGGRDRFAFHATWETGDTITDFQGGVFGDLIDLSVLAAKYNWSSSLDLFAGGYVRFVQDGADVRVLVDTDGGGADYVDLTRLSNVNASSLGAANLLTELSAGQDLKPAPTRSAAVAGGTVYGTEDNDVYYASTQYPNLVGNGGDDLLFGSAGNNLLEGGAGNDAMTGEAGNDTLDGGSGADWMEGGTGDDLYTVDSTSDVVIEQADSGFDTIQTSISPTGSLAANVEALTLIGTALNATANDLDNIVTGNSSANILYGRAGNDALQGAAGNDRLYGDAGDDNLHGGDGNDTLYGGDGNDVLFGNAGADVLSGNLGYDTVSYADGEIGVVADLATPSASAGAAAGDTFYSIENLTGSSFADTLSGNSTGNVLDGGIGDDHLSGRDGGDTLRGGDGSDFLDGGLRKDVLTGGAGEDTFYFASTVEAGDTITDFGPGDHIALSAVGFGIQSTDDFAFVLASAPMTAKPTVIYNSATGVLSWDADGSGAGTAVHLATLIGAPAVAHSDFLVNGSTLGAALLVDRSAAADGVLYGTEADDVYTVDTTEYDVIEQSNGGFDMVLSSVSNGTPLFANVEALTLTGTGMLTGTGNSLDNVITGNAGVNFLYGGAGNDTMSGLDGSDKLYGEDGDDDLSGGAGNDTLYGGAGNDVLQGGDGADVLSGSLGYDTVTYEDSQIGAVVDLASSAANSGAAAGDTLSSIENLTGTAFADMLLGGQSGNILESLAGDDRLYGRDGADTLRGGEGNDFLDGGARKDILTGGAGADTFYFASTAEGGDTITDFAAGTYMASSAAGLSVGDHIALSATGFGVQSTEDFAFALSSGALTGMPTAIYDAATGSLSWDADGAGAGQAVHLATLSGAPAPTHNDFLVI